MVGSDWTGPGSSRTCRYAHYGQGKYGNLHKDNFVAVLQQYNLPGLRDIQVVYLQTKEVFFSIWSWNLYKLINISYCRDIVRNERL